jgi:3-oxoacyl-[acyl-carrier protein] reductase
MRFQDRVAIVTGAAAGIGRGIAQKFASEGAAVVIADIDEEGLRTTAAQIDHQRVVAIRADVGVVEDTRLIVAEALARFGAIHILVNNAASTRLQKPVQEMTVEEWDLCQHASLRSVFLLSKWAGPVIRDSGGGSIVNLGSVGAVTAWAGGAAYCSAKAGVVALTKVLATEYGPWKIRVNCISPGAIMTPNLEASIARNQHLDRLCARSVLGRVGEVDEIANVAAFLASTDASYMTAANVLVDGGWLTK